MAGGKEPRSLTKWLTFSPNEMELAPGETRDINCQIIVPNDPTLTGSYWGVVFVEQAPEVGASKPKTHIGMTQVGIDTIFRYAVKIYVTIKGTETRAALFTGLDIKKNGSELKVKAILQDKGNIVLRPKVWVEIRDTSDSVVLTQEYVHQTVLPDTSRSYNFDLQNVSIPPGTYLVMVIADYDGPKAGGSPGKNGADG